MHPRWDLNSQCSCGWLWPSDLLSPPPVLDCRHALPCLVFMQCRGWNTGLCACHVGTLPSMPGGYSTKPHGAFEIFFYIFCQIQKITFTSFPLSLPPSFLPLFPSLPPPFLPSPKGRYLSQAFLSFCVCYKLSTVSFQGLQIPHSQINKLQVEIIHKKKLRL